MTKKSKTKPITEADVQSWLGYTPEHEKKFPLHPGCIEYARKEIGKRLIGRQSGANFFSDRLFKDLCSNVRDAYVLATEPAESKLANSPNPKIMRERLDDLAASASTLLAQIEGLERFDKALLEYNYQDGPQRLGSWRDGLPALRNLLGALASDASDAATSMGKLVKSGTPALSPLTHLIHHVNLALKSNGIPTNARQSGALHTFCAIVLEVPEYRQAFGDPRSLRGHLRNVLDQGICNPYAIGLAAMGYK